ncbi:MAG: enoyl-CoA hydratase/isomerase family protein, partial [Acidobacteriia bacterium]|nr:enoyl-CoA hydratase/isomerase family protein [Terriglobia bacterium]
MKTGYKTVKVEMKDGVAVLSLNNPPVNQLSEHFVREMADALLQASTDPSVKAVILTGTGKNFIAGADITQIQPIRDKNFLLPRVMENNRFINGIEEGPKPVIAAINGHCLGGGLEIAMACHYRIAAQGVQIGQPEVQIGLIPGAGGTQRLARLVGFAEALTMITTGNPVSAEEGLKKGALDEVVPPNELINQAQKTAGRFISGELNHKNRMTRNKTDKLPKPEEKKGIIAFAKGMAAKQAKGYLAPFKAIEAMERGLTDNFEADLKIEAELFADCAVSDIAKNLIGIFLNTRAAGKLPRIEKIAPQKIKTVAMLGGGVMGSGIVNLL